MPHWWLLNFENMSTNLAISRARAICWDELEPPSGQAFFSGRWRGNRVQSGGSQITVRSIGHRRREHDDVPIRSVDGPTGTIGDGFGNRTGNLTYHTWLGTPQWLVYNGKSCEN